MYHRAGKGEERPCLIGRIEDVRVIYESSTLDENIKLLSHYKPIFQFFHSLDQFIKRNGFTINHT